MLNFNLNNCKNKNKYMENSWGEKHPWGGGGGGGRGYPRASPPCMNPC